MRRRVIGVVAALLLAGFGTFVLVGYVQGASERAAAGQELVNVLVVTGPVSARTPATELGALVELRQVPLESRAVGAVVDLAELGETVTSVELVPGEQIVAARFVDPSALEPEREGVPIPIVRVPEGMVEVSFAIEPERMLGGLVAPGDLVTVVASFDAVRMPAAAPSIQVGGSVFVLPDDATEGGAGEAAQVSASRVVLQSALVTRIQAEIVPEMMAGDGDRTTLLVPAGGFNVTLALDPLDLERLVFAKEFGRLWLAYQPEEMVFGSTPGQSFESIFADSPGSGGGR